MKTLKFLSIILIILIIGIGCKSKQKITKLKKSQEVQLPFADGKYNTTKNEFRTLKYGTDKNLIVAEELAKSNARTDIAYQVNTIVQNVTDIYLNKKNNDGSIKFERLSRQTSEEILTNIKVVDKKIFIDEDGKWTYWVIMEVKKKDVINISYNSFEQVDIDKYQYERTFDEALEDLQKLKE